MPAFRRIITAVVLAFSIAAPAQKTKKPLVVLISVDGMKPEAVLDAATHGLKLPNLTQMMHDGVYAKGVTGVLATLTYPSHTTIMTGASPAKHGIYSNTTFDPLNKNQVGWYWYSRGHPGPDPVGRGPCGRPEDGKCVLAGKRRDKCHSCAHRLQPFADLAQWHCRRPEAAALGLDARADRGAGDEGVHCGSA